MIVCEYRRVLKLLQREVPAKQVPSRNSLKRGRAAEFHNLSEKVGYICYEDMYSQVIQFFSFYKIFLFLALIIRCFGLDRGGGAGLMRK